MAEIPAPKNRLVDFANKVIGFIVNVCASLGVYALKIFVPVFSWPVVSQLLDIIVSHYKEYVFQFFSEHSTMVLIDFQEASKKQEYLASVRDYALAQQSGDKDALEKARQKFKDDLARLGHFGSP